MAEPRCILHLDMDAFFAAVEQHDHPELRGRPVLIGHDGPRGVVATASYEARVFGCHSAQPMAHAKRLCPQAVILPVRGSRYHEVSQQMFAILDEFSPRIEPLSIDEAFLDLTGTGRALGPPQAVARRLQERVRTDLGLTASVGLAANKFLAKLASDMNKPDGLTMLGADAATRVLPPLPVTRVWGIGPATAARLEPLGIRTIGDLQQRPPEWFARHFGAEAQRYFNLVRGLDDRPVEPDQQAKSIGHEQTFAQDLADAEEIRRVLFDQVEQVACRLRKHGLQARAVTLKVRFGNFQTVTRSATLRGPTDITTELWQTARDLFDRWPFQPVRLIGVTADRLSAGAGQLGLFHDPARERQKKLDGLADQINTRLGRAAIKRAGTR